MVNKCLINWPSASIILAVEYKMSCNGTFLISFRFFVMCCICRTALEMRVACLWRMVCPSTPCPTQTRETTLKLLPLNYITLYISWVMVTLNSWHNDQKTNHSGCLWLSWLDHDLLNYFWLLSDETIFFGKKNIFFVVPICLAVYVSVAGKLANSVPVLQCSRRSWRSRSHLWIDCIFSRSQSRTNSTKG